MNSQEIILYIQNQFSWFFSHVSCAMHLDGGYNKQTTVLKYLEKLKGEGKSLDASKTLTSLANHGAVLEYS